MTDEDARAALDSLIRERKEDYASLSRLIGRGPAYIQQYIKRGVPRRLNGDDRRTLARYFGVNEASLGGPWNEDAAQLHSTDAQPDRGSTGLVPIRRLNVEASAGHGASVDRELALVPMSFDRRWLRELVGSDLDQLSIIRLRGDSMSPTLLDGDDILVNRADGAERLRDGIYVLRLDDVLMVKRLAINPMSRRVTVSSDNPAYPSWPDCQPQLISVIGRVAWGGRRFG
jgi:phage repressor protein C with HTH and peptisase S24 domain